jgi:hypothetical protein
MRHQSEEVHEFMYGNKCQRKMQILTGVYIMMAVIMIQGQDDHQETKTKETHSPLERMRRMLLGRAEQFQ